MLNKIRDRYLSFFNGSCLRRKVRKALQRTKQLSFGQSPLGQLSLGHLSLGQLSLGRSKQLPPRWSRHWPQHWPQHWPRHWPQHSPRRKRRGLIGVLLTVAIVAIVIVALLAIYNQIITNVRATRIVTMVNSIETTTRRLFYNEQAYPANMTIPLIIAGAVPSGSVTGTGDSRQVITPYGIILVQSFSANTFRVTVFSLPSSVCSRVASSYIGTDSVMSVAIQNVVTASVADVLTECDGDAVANTVQITFNG